MAGKGTILAVTEKTSIFGILCAILIKKFDVLCTDGSDLNADSEIVRDAKCVVVDLEMSSANPAILIENLKRAHPSARVIALATAKGQHLIEQAKKAGARDVLMVPDEIERLASMIHSTG